MKKVRLWGLADKPSTHLGGVYLRPLAGLVCQMDLTKDETQMPLGNCLLELNRLGWKLAFG